MLIQDEVLLEPRNSSPQNPEGKNFGTHFIQQLRWGKAVIRGGIPVERPPTEIYESCQEQKVQRGAAFTGGVKYLDKTINHLRQNMSQFDSLHALPHNPEFLLWKM